MHPNAIPVEVRQHSRHRYLHKPTPLSHKLMLRPMSSLTSPEPLPELVDHSKWLLEPRNQGQEGCCTGFSESAIREALHGMATGTPLSFYLSPAMIYWEARKAEHQEDKDSGANLGDGFGCMEGIGICPDSVFPYSDRDFLTPPPPPAYVAAAPYRIDLACRVDIDDEIEIKQALVHAPVAIGFTVYESFETQTGADGKVAPPSGPLMGGHAVLVVGYIKLDDGIWYWKVRNSWGPTWGDHGYFYMPFGYEKNWYEAWTASPQP